MKRLLLAMLAVGSLVAVSGCPTSPTGGIATPTGGSSTATRDEKFSLDKILLPTNLKQGGAGEVTIKVNRGKDFKQKVKLTAKPSSDKIKAEFNPTSVDANSEPRAVMKIIADKDAEIGSHTITVTATPEAGDATSIEIKVSVDKP